VTKPRHKAREEASANVSTAKNIRSGVTQEQRDEVRRSLNELVEKLAGDMKLDPCAVVLELRYYHQSGSNPYRTTATKSDKRASLAHFKNVCQGCRTGEPLDLAEAAFHHERRGFADQHRPPNLAPYHRDCHNREHHLPEGSSVHKGAPKARAR
jgi:5-methylcytosine-specific restriction endonuclease McrA